MNLSVCCHLLQDDTYHEAGAPASEPQEDLYAEAGPGEEQPQEDLYDTVPESKYKL